MFELPLLNTIILLSSGSTITWSHHSLIQGKRQGALYGSIATVILAIIFTALQGVEYNVSSFTISDGAFGSCFFFGTGFHGLICGAQYIYIYLFKTITTFYYTKHYFTTNINLKDKLRLRLNVDRPNRDNFYLNKSFIEWFVGFSDAVPSGSVNFNIKLTDFKKETFKYVQFMAEPPNRFT